jgi:hypothetical protein
MSEPDDGLAPPPPPSFPRETPWEAEHDYDEADVDPRLAPGQPFGHPPAYHDSERLQPPPVSGSID